MSNLLVSFVVPTYNRSKYCISLIKSISLISGDFEVIISDNSTDKLLLNFINQNKIDERINYQYIDKKLNMTQNLNRAISFAKGYYLCCIGDDDTIMPNFFKYLCEFKTKGVDIISPVISINYCWPDFSSKYFENSHKSRLYYKLSEPYLHIKSAKESFEKAAYNCFQGTNGMPKLYHGFVKREYFETIKLQGGDYLFGSAPDVSASVLLSKSCNSYVETNIPLTIPGASSGSNTGRAAKNKHFGKLEDEHQTKDFIQSWPEFLPRIFTVETVWAHSAIVSFSNLLGKELNFNYIKLYSLILVNNKGSYVYLKDLILKLPIFKKIELIYHILFQFFKKQISRLKRVMIPTASGGRSYISDINNLEEVISRAKSITLNKNFDQVKSIDLIKNMF